MVAFHSFEEYPHISKPRRLLKYVLIWCSGGSVNIVVDEAHLQLKKHDVLTITSGQIHYAQDPVEARGCILEFTLDFFARMIMI